MFNECLKLVALGLEANGACVAMSKIAYGALKNINASLGNIDGKADRTVLDRIQFEDLPRPEAFEDLLLRLPKIMPRGGEDALALMTDLGYEATYAIGAVLKDVNRALVRNETLTGKLFQRCTKHLEVLRDPKTTDPDAMAARVDKQIGEVPDTEKHLYVDAKTTDEHNRLVDIAGAVMVLLRPALQDVVNTFDDIKQKKESFMFPAVYKILLEKGTLPPTESTVDIGEESRQPPSEEKKLTAEQICAELNEGLAKDIITPDIVKEAEDIPSGADEPKNRYHLATVACNILRLAEFNALDNDGKLKMFADCEHAALEKEEADELVKRLMFSAHDPTRDSSFSRSHYISRMRGVRRLLQAMHLVPLLSKFDSYLSEEGGLLERLKAAVQLKVPPRQTPVMEKWHKDGAPLKPVRESTDDANGGEGKKKANKNDKGKKKATADALDAMEN